MLPIALQGQARKVAMEFKFMFFHVCLTLQRVRISVHVTGRLQSKGDNLGESMKGQL